MVTNTPQQPRYRTGIEADTLEAGREASPSLAAASSLVACTAAGLLRVAALPPPPSAEADASIRLGRGEGLRRAARGVGGARWLAGAAHGEWLAGAGTAGSGARGGSLCGLDCARANSLKCPHPPLCRALDQEALGKGRRQLYRVFRSRTSLHAPNL